MFCKHAGESGRKSSGMPCSARATSCRRPQERGAGSIVGERGRRGVRENVQFAAVAAMLAAVSPCGLNRARFTLSRAGTYRGPLLQAWKRWPWPAACRMPTRSAPRRARPARLPGERPHRIALQVRRARLPIDERTWALDLPSPAVSLGSCPLIARLAHRADLPAGAQRFQDELAENGAALCPQRLPAQGRPAWPISLLREQPQIPDRPPSPARQHPGRETRLPS